MNDIELPPIENLGIPSDSPLEEKVECILSALDSAMDSLHDLPADPVDAALAGSEARRTFRQCSRHVSRSATDDETAKMLELTLLRLCHRMAHCHSGADDEWPR